jgi:hypothetical protein
MMPKPFVINDAVIIKKGIAIEEYQEKTPDTSVTNKALPEEIFEKKNK